MMREIEKMQNQNIEPPLFPLDMKMSDQKNTTPPKIFGAINAIMMEMKHVGKNQFNGGQQFNFRGIDDMYNAVHALFAKHKVFTTSAVIHSERRERATQKSVATFSIIRIRYTFWAIDGSSVSTEVEGEGLDYGDKSTAKALSMADKYALIQFFKIPTSDIADGDKESFRLEAAPKISDEQIKEIEDKITLSGVKKSAFMNWLGTQQIDSIANIPAEKFNMVLDKFGEVLSKKQEATASV